jgi:endoglucanase
MHSILSKVFCLFLISGLIGAKEYDLKTVLHDSLLFYEAQRSGKLPADQRVTWRGDSMLDDGKTVGHDLTGGYFDAGDLVKFGFPMAYTVTMLSWGAVDYADAYTKAGEMDNVLKAIKWGTDYFIKCHTSDTEFYGQVGNGNEDHAMWTRPEDWPKDKVRPAYKVTSARGGSDLVGETAAAMAAASMAFKKSDATYSEKLLKEAKSLYQFANAHRATYTEEISDAQNFYKSWSGFGDELAWSAAWLLRATGDAMYKTEVEKHMNEFGKQLKGKPVQFSWDDKTAGVQILLAEVTKEEQYKTMAKTFCDWIVHEAPKTPKGMVYLDQWGTLRHAGNAAFLCLQAGHAGINEAEYRKFAESQIGYILGDAGHSFVVGFGENSPTRPHHRASSCPVSRSTKCDWAAMNNQGPNPNVLTGALVGGPDKSDNYVDKRDDFVHNEVACDYNAAFTGALAGLLHLKN